MSDLPINLFDAIIIGILLMSGLLAFFRGFTREVLSIFAWVGALLVVLQGFQHVSPYVYQFISAEWIADIATVVGLFIITLILLTIISHGIAKRVQESAVGPLDRTLGFLFGAVRGWVIITIAYLAMIWLIEQDQRPPWILEARALPLIETSADLLLILVPNSSGDGGSMGLPKSIFSKESQDARIGSQILRVIRPAEDKNSNSGEDSSDETGYKAPERRTLERMFQATQDP